LAGVLTAKTEEARRAAAVAVYTTWNWNRILTPRIVFLMIPVVGLVLWTYPYWFPGGKWESRWSTDAAWSHAYLIPFIAVLIAGYRLKEVSPLYILPSAWGLLLILAGLVLRLVSQTLMFGYPGEISFLLVVAGVVHLLLGRQMLRILWVPIAYLGLMIPWEQKYYEGISLPLQNFAAVASERILTLCGMAISRSGNVLQPEDSPAVGVAHACSGLHLLFTFVALGVLMAYMYRRPLWERLLIIGSSLPIAVLCNVIRVVLMTGASHTLFLEGKAVAAGSPGWSSWIPAGVWQFLWPGPGEPARSPDWLMHPSANREMVGFVSPDLWGNFFTGGDLAVSLSRVYESVMTPTSYLHQSFGFAMLGLAFVLMWLELKCIDMLFVDDEPAGPPGALAPDRAAR
jgi:exosortase